MLNEELKKDIDIEISKAPEEVGTFVRSPYFRDTMNLIVKVNKLSEPQAESVELETLLMVLGLSDYATIEEAISKECDINAQESVRQISKDIKEYVIDRIENKPAVVISSSGEENSAPLRNIIQDAYGKEMLGPASIDYYENKRQTSANAAQNTLVITAQNEGASKNENQFELEGIEIDEDKGGALSQPLHDVYRELADEHDYKVQKEEAL